MIVAYSKRNDWPMNRNHQDRLRSGSMVLWQVDLNHLYAIEKRNTSTKSKYITDDLCLILITHCENLFSEMVKDR